MNRRDVIDHLKIIRTWAAVGKDPIYRGIEPKCCEDVERWIDEALKLLKKQEPKPAETYGRTDWYGFACICPDCKKEWMSDMDDTHFCPYCGQEVNPK